MRKMLCSALVILVLMCLGAQAEESGVLDLTQMHDYETVTSLCFVDDTLYMLGSYGIYAYTDGALSTFVDLTQAYPYRYTFQRPQEGADAWEMAVSKLFTDGNTLFAVHPYSGQVFSVTQGVLTPYAQLPEDLLYVADNDLYREIKGIACEGKTVYVLLGTDDYSEYDKTELVAWTMGDQEVRVCSPEHVQSITCGASGKLILFIQDEAQSALWQYDMATDTLEQTVALLQMGDSPSGLAWSGSQPVYYLNNRVIAASPDQEWTKAYLPVSYAFVETSAACSKDGLYAYPFGNHVFLRDIGFEGETEQNVLTVMGSISPDLLVGYSIDHPEVAVVTVETLNASEITQAALSGDSSMDAFVLSAPGSFAAMKEKGYIAPLNQDVDLVEDAKTYYPAVQDVLFDGEQLMGVPLNFSPKCWTVNATQWDALGLGELPKTYHELLALIDTWLLEYADTYPEYTLCDVQQGGLSSLVFLMVEAYIEQFEIAGEPLSFDTPAFRETLMAVSENQDLLSEEHEQWGMALLSSYSMGFGVTYADRDEMWMMVPPAIDASIESQMSASMDVLCVHAASTQINVAAQFVAYCAESLPLYARYELCPDMNDPVESQTYQERLVTLEAELKELQTQYESAEEEEMKYALEDRIVQTETMIESVSENPWEISPQSIELYRQIAQNIHIPYQSVLLVQGSSGGYQALYDVVLQYCSGEFNSGTVDAMINELNRVAMMVDMENR